MRERVKSDLNDHLYEGYATLMFDSLEVVNQRPMTIVLVRVSGDERYHTKTYYLTTVFSGTRRSDTSMYIEIAEEAIKDWVGTERLAGIVTDNTANVKKARETLMKKYPRVIASQDQAHVADRLMADIGEITWIRDAIETSSALVVHYRRFRKVKMRLQEKIDAHNSKMRAAASAGLNHRVSTDRRESNTAALNDVEEGNEVSNPRQPATVEDVRHEATAAATGPSPTAFHHVAPEPSSGNEIGCTNQLLCSSFEQEQAGMQSVQLIDLREEGYVGLQEVIEASLSTQEDPDERQTYLIEEEGDSQDPSAPPRYGSKLALPNSADSTGAPFAFRQDCQKDVSGTVCLCRKTSRGISLCSPAS